MFETPGLFGLSTWWLYPEPDHEVVVWLTDQWFTLHYARGRAKAIEFQRLAEYGWGLPAVVRVVS